MPKTNRRQRWINTMAAYVGGREATCPVCGGHKFEYGYVEVNKTEHLGWGAFWCEDCRSAFVLSRVLLTEETRQKTVSSLPKDLKFI